MKSEPVTAYNANVYEQKFKVGQRIYYAVVVPEKFGDDTLRIQVIKQDTKVSSFGYNLAFSESVAIDPSEKYYRNYIVLNEAGYYILQIFEFRNMVTPLARYDFWVE